MCVCVSMCLWVCVFVRVCVCMCLRACALALCLGESAILSIAGWICTLPVCLCENESMYVRACEYVCVCQSQGGFAHYGVATISRLLNIIDLFGKRALKRVAILQKRPIILKSLLIVATPYRCVCERKNENVCVFVCVYLCVCVYVYACVRVRARILPRILVSLPSSRLSDDFALCRYVCVCVRV